MSERYLVYGYSEDGGKTIEGKPSLGTREEFDNEVRKARIATDGNWDVVIISEVEQFAPAPPAAGDDQGYDHVAFFEDGKFLTCGTFDREDSDAAIWGTFEENYHMRTDTTEFRREPFTGKAKTDRSDPNNDSLHRLTVLINKKQGIWQILRPDGEAIALGGFEEEGSKTVIQESDFEREDLAYLLVEAALNGEI